MKLRHRKGYYEGCYHDIDAKDWSCGETLTVKEALDLWWNSVRINTGDKCVYCWKNAYTCDPAYVGDGEALKSNFLNREITLDDEWDYDADGYPIVYAEFKN